MKKIELLSRALILCAAGSLGACSSDKPVNIGNTNMIGAQLSDYAATWDGYAEAFTFSDGSDRVRLTIDANGQGTLQVGDAALLAPPSDPNVGYPTDQPGGIEYSLIAGFLYPIYATQVQEARIQLGAVPGDLYAAWCALQTPVPYEITTIVMQSGTEIIIGASDAGVVSTQYACVAPNTVSGAPGGGCQVTNADGGTSPISCQKTDLCQGPQPACTCTASACASVQVPAGTPVAQYPVELDGALDATGKILTGTLTVGNGVTVHLTRQ
jgi:hypothetical protein